MKKVFFVSQLLCFLLILSCSAPDKEEEIIVFDAAAKFSVEKEYKGNLETILGDVKQAFIQEKLSSKDQINMLVKGFKYEFKVDGIRIPIFPEGHITKEQKQLLHFLVAKCKAEKLLIFANPANHAGGQRIANGDLGDLSPVLGDQKKSDILVNRIISFAEEFELDFISPFNEDAAPGRIWSAEQINYIYASIKGNVGGAKLLGSDVWGLPAGIKYLDETRILDYVDISTTHNLGFNHGRWQEYIEKSKGFPVWDSEVNMFKKFANRKTRIEAAIDNGVNGLVLYNSWNMINLNTGEIGSSGKKFRDYYLK
ncbi:hypothetical protein [Gramella sp. AN32]|uniref:Uncharacterized protein n=1 Tax=Christiangramia antarctica TaxID=2058158 RepID=A0ABW5X3H6_9FLAO|nr:hypothetical protein [Gramella sp. AN32]MCM4155792.1 hypothetical protein [Gramella sp. AN32]